MIKKSTVYLVVAILLAAGPLYAAKVTNIELSYQPNTTVARIFVDGQVRFTHQTEVPKDGKPDRLIVDILAAEHGLGSAIFSELPLCCVQSVRSSQYAVSPEKVVRVVFDLQSAPLYRIESDDHSITVYFTDQDVPRFVAWSSSIGVKQAKAEEKVAENAPAAAPKAATKSAAKAASKNQKPVQLSVVPPVSPVIAMAEKAVEAEVKSSAEKPSAQEETPAKPVVKARVVASKKDVSTAPGSGSPVLAESKPVSPVASKPVSAPAVSVKPEESNAPAMAPSVAQMKAKVQPQVEPKSVETAKPEVSSSIVAAVPPVVEAKVEVKPQVEPKSVETAKPEVSSSIVAAVPPPAEVKADVSAKSEPAPEELTEQKQPTEQQMSEPVPADMPVPTVADNDKQAEENAPMVANADESEDMSRSNTSRFRRAPTKSKAKGTMVAEFPTRLVIKYRAMSRRDPFETLINDTKTYNNPIEQKMANVEGLRLVGIIESGTDENRALFEDNDGYGYILKSGDKVKNGYVLRVEADRVFFQIFEYGWSRTVALRIEE